MPAATSHDPTKDIVPSRRSGFWARAGTLMLTLAIFAGSAALVVMGRDALARAADAAPDAPTAPLTAVSVLNVTPEAGYTVTRRFVGQVEAVARTDLGFEQGGRITEVRFEEGDVVRAGDTLALLDTTSILPERAALVAQRAALTADAELARLTLARSVTLTELGHRSTAAQDDARLTLARVEANIAALDAQIAGVDVALEKSRLVAPFDARVGDRLADPGQTVAAGQTIAVLFDTAPARLRVGLPPDLAATLAVGDALRVDIDGRTVAAEVVAIRPDLDASTRSRAVLLDLPTSSPYGETATLFFEQTVADPGFWVPIAALREGARGSWTVMAIAPDPAGDRVVPAAVEVLHATAERVFLRGSLPSGGQIVATGAHRIAPNQVVLALAE